MITIRASSLPTVSKCPGAALSSITSIDEPNVTGETGTAVHKCLERLVSHGAVNWRMLDSIFLSSGLDQAEVRMLFDKASRMWRTLASDFGSAVTEIATEYQSKDGKVRITGHIDLLSVSGESCRILDWKTGRKDGDYRQQMLAYLSMALLSLPNLLDGYATIAWIRDEDVEQYHMVLAEAEEWLEARAAEISGWDGTYHPGEHCQRCNKRYGCHAVNTIIRAHVAWIAGADVDVIADEIDAMSPTDVVTIYHKAKLVTSVAKRLLAAIKARAMREEIVDVYGETMLTARPEHRRELISEKAWPVLEEEGFTEEDFAACASLGIMKLEYRLAQKAGGGIGASAKRSIMHALESAGALKTVETRVLTERRKP